MRLTRPTRPSTTPTLLIALLSTSTLFGCARDPVSNETPAPGEPARIEVLSITHAGGYETRELTRIDSTSGRYAIRSCEGASIGSTCTDLRLVREGDVIPYQLKDLFESTTRPAFRALLPSYPGASSETPPDGGTVQLTVVRNGTSRQITWSIDAYLPSVLVDFTCLFRSVRGELLLCD